MRYHVRGFSLLEFIIIISIISIIFGTGAILITSSTQNYFEQKKLNLGLSVKNINFNRLNNYLSPIFKNLHQPLFNAATGDVIIIASANTDDYKTLDDNNIFMSQLIKISLIDSEITMEKFPPSLNGGTDTIYGKATSDFNTITNNLISTSTSIANNVSSLDIEYLDLDTNPTAEGSEISFISIRVTILSSTVSRTRTTIISPWRILLL